MVALAEGAGGHRGVGFERIGAENPEQNAAEDERQGQRDQRKGELTVTGTIQSSFKNKLHGRISSYHL